MGEEPRTLEYNYKFTLDDGVCKEFHIRLDRRSLRFQGQERSEYPDWTRLSNSQCPNCPLTEDRHPRCPIAENLVDVIDFFKDRLSTEKVTLEVASEARTYVSRTPISPAVSALIGLHMVTSGCPILDKMKPMTQTHLPFSTLRESLYRTLAMYMLAQHFRLRKGLKPDWEMKGLPAFVQEIHGVNAGFCERLGSVCPADANLNAVIRLDSFADSSSYQVEEDELDHLAESFTAHF
ncbi:MAG: hypothetical protein ABII00_10145 [Elusimicrobiota bacterium]